MRDTSDSNGIPATARCAAPARAGPRCPTQLSSTRHASQRVPCLHTAAPPRPPPSPPRQVEAATLDAPPAPEPRTIPLTQLNGHRGPVLALAVNSAGLLASASEDGTSRLWDVKGGRSLRMASAGAPINSIAFGARDQLLVAVGTALHVYDLRKPDVILRTPEAKHTVAEEEINQV